MIRVLLLLGLALAPLLPAAAQATDDDESFLVDLVVNYGVAFREGTWVPVDVYIRNNERSVSGFVEIRTFGFSGNVQSPVYRVPAELPKGTQKRIRVLCRLEQTDRMEARVFHGSRPVSPVPTRVTLTPIDRSDYLGLILDDQHHDYGFLSHGTVIGRPETRFHREGLNTEQLGYLADHLACYTTFDLIILGNTDPERISPAHRELLQQYVSMGGSLVVCLGKNANLYKGSWLEPLMGVTIGENDFVSEAALASEALAGTRLAAAADAAREGVVTRIVPAEETVTPIGNDYRLGAIHPVGAGRVATITVDAESKLMQDNPSFLRYWNGLLERSIVDRPLNLPAVIDYATQQLPAIAGVKLFPVSSVITYLLLYFFIAIVGNWLFWNWMKRREMAWVCLVFFSFAFTTYAMIFGTQGRARTTELEQLEILEVNSQMPTGTLHSVTGLLAKGSGRFDAALIQPDSLVTDAARTMFLGARQPGGVFGPQGENPFQFVQADPGRVEGVTVGASEMRFLQTESPIHLDGALVADLIAGDTGLQGTIRNETGLQLVSPYLLYEGSVIPLTFQDNTATVSVTPDIRSAYRQVQLHVPPAGATTIPADMDPGDRRNFENFLSMMPQLLLNREGGSTTPCIVAWAKREPFGSLDLGTRAEIRLASTLVIAWIEIQRTERPDSLLLFTSLGGGYAGQPVAPISESPPETPDAWCSNSFQLYPGGAMNLRIAIPEWLRGSEEYLLEVTLWTDDAFYTDRPGDCTRTPNAKVKEQITLSHVTEEGGAVLMEDGMESTLDMGGTTCTARTFQIDHWGRLLPPRSASVPLRIDASPDVPDAAGTPSQQRFRQQFQGGMPSFGGGGAHYRAHITARKIKKTQQPAGV
jgi:hypothetical protein